MRPSSGGDSAKRMQRFCSDVSRENDEPLSATASRIDHWLLVEYRGLWGPNAVRASGLSDQLKQHLRAQVEARPHTRLLFVRRPDRRGRPELTAFAATSREGEERARCVRFEHHEDLREVELATAGEELDHPLFLVCTHGKHDPCCARLGRPLFEALAEQLDEEWVWQSTHIGGDRFAGNLVCLPEGVYYGRVGREAAVEVLDRHLAGTIALDFYRGRSAHTFAVQAAERDVRERSSFVGLADLRFGAARRTGARVHVEFVDAGGGRHAREVVETLGPEDFLTCKADEMRRPRRFEVSPGRA